MEQNSLPKNIRQIGQIGKQPQIYIEDYVITFARKLAECNQDGKGMAVLLGKEASGNGKEPVFIKGAVEIKGWEAAKGTTFDNEIWSNIYEGVKNNFPDLEIVGWMFLHLGQEAGFDEKVKQIHESNFIGNGSILFVFDKGEKEENFYRYEHSHFEKQTGYFIYYEKNEPMQNYMIEMFGNKSQEIVGEDKVMEQVRELIASKEATQDKKTGNFIYAASTALAAVVLVIGVTTLSNYDKMESMEQTLNHISATMKEKEEEELVVTTITGTVEDKTERTDKPSQNTTDASEENIFEKKEENKENTENDVDADKKKNTDENSAEDTEDSDSTKRKEEALEAAMKEGNYYIVKKGDTLVGISGAVYGSDEYVAKIQKLNDIDDQDMIYEGQILIMP